MNYFQPAQVAIVPKLKADLGGNFLNFILHGCGIIQQQKIHQKTKVPKHRALPHRNADFKVFKFSGVVLV